MFLITFVKELAMNCCDSFGACHQGPHCPVRQAGAACGSACAGSSNLKAAGAAVRRRPWLHIALALASFWGVVAVVAMTALKT